MSKKTPRSPNENGFIVLTLVLMPAMFVLAFGAFHINTQIIQEREPQNLCRDRLLAAQAAQSVGIQRLMALNPIVAKLNRRHFQKKIQLEIAVAAMNPMAVQYAAELAGIVALQEAMVVRQQAIIAAGRARLATELVRLRSELEARVRARRARSGTGSFEARFRVPQPREWALIPQGTPYPEYHPPGDFTERQALHVDWNWSFTPHEGVENWIPWKTRKKLRCGASLVRRGGSFESRIHEDRSFLKSW